MRVQVSEERILEGIEIFREHFNHEPIKLISTLEIGEKFREAGLTPCYIFSMDEQMFWVTSEEHMDNKLN